MTCRLHKIFILGDAGVGKSSFISRYINDQCTDSYKATIGADFYVKDMRDNGDGDVLQIWDISGPDGCGVGYKSADAWVLMYDLNSPESLQNLEAYYRQVCSVFNTDIPCVVVGNKLDLIPKGAKEVLPSLPFHLRDMPHFCASAKDKINIDMIFQELITLCNLRAAPAQCSKPT